MAIDPKLLVIKPFDELSVSNNPLNAQTLLYDGSLELKRYPLNNLKAEVASGIKGEAVPSTVPTPWTSGDPDLYEKYDVKTAGTYTNFKDSNNASIIISTDDLEDNLVQLWVTNGVSQRVVIALPSGTTVSPEFDPTTETEAQGGKQIFDFVLENKVFSGNEWIEQNKVVGSYIIDDTVSSFAGYDYIKLTDVSYIEKLRLSGRTRNIGEPTIHVCYGKLITGGFEILYDEFDLNISNLEITIEPNKFSALYVNLRNSIPTKIEAFFKLSFDKIYATPTDLNTEILDVRDWVLNNMETVREETIPAMYDYTMLSDGSFISLGSDYRHTDYYEFQAGDKLEIEYGTDATLHYLFTFTPAKVFIEGLWQEIIATGGRKTKTFEPDFDGFLVMNSNFQNTLGLPKITKIYQQIRFLTPQSGGGGVATKAHFYDIDAHYLEADGGDYGITLNRINSIMTERGGIIDFGVKDYRIDTFVTFTKSVVLRGLGCMEFYGRRWMSGIYTTSGTMDMISVAGGVYFFAGNIHFYNIATLPTAGSGLRLKGSTPASGSDADKILSLVSGSIIQNCSFEGFYDNMMFDNACQWTLINPLSNYAVRYGLYIDAERHRDAGDSTILGGNFYGFETSMNRVSKSHIYHKGSGGLKITSVKFNNKADYSILGEIAGDTVILNVSNCSFENHNIGAIKYSKTSSVFRHINISNCEFDSYKVGTTDVDIRTGIQDINIIGNSFSSGMTSASNTAINLNGVDGVRLMNTYRGYTSPMNVYNSTNVKEAALQDPIATNINK